MAIHLSTWEQNGRTKSQLEEITGIGIVLYVTWDIGERRSIGSADVAVKDTNENILAIKRL